jgi:predicted house-cleaning noncanonical NTP pyrophosphatase (MazG superfamily)
MQKNYNKLVRDLIPEIIQKSGNKCVISTLNDEDYAKELEKKLLEEVNEYLSDKTAEELADILEVVYALCDNLGHSADELAAVYQKKHDERGGFRNKIFLIGDDK